MVRGLGARLIDERLILGVICLNTAAIFLRAFPAIRVSSADHLLFAVDYACGAYFLVELALKLKKYGWDGYWSGGWNRFDFFVVVLSTPMLVAPVFAEDFALVLVLRLGRVLRAFRLLRFVPDADRLWGGIRRALRASVGVLVALVVYNLALGLCACTLFGKLAPQYFADPLLATYSMFKVFTVEGWYENPDYIAATASPAWAVASRVFFVFSVATGGLLGLSMANAVFVDEMVMDNTDMLEEELLRVRDDIREVSKMQREQLAGHREELARVATAVEVLTEALAQERAHSAATSATSAAGPSTTSLPTPSSAEEPEPEK